MHESYKLNEFIDINQLKHLDAIQRNKTFSAAARELGVSQPALTRSMKKLEEQLGLTLFERSKSKAALNSTGEYAAKLASESLAHNLSFIQRVRAFDRGANEIRVASCGPWPLMDIAPLMQRFFPGNSVTTVLIENEQGLDAALEPGRYHLVITRKRLDRRDIVSIPYARENLTLAVKQDHPLAKRDSVSLSELEGLNILSWGAPCFWVSIIREKCAANVLFQENIAAMEQLIKNTELPAFSSDRMAEAGYTEPDRVDIVLEDAELHVEYYVSCLKTDLQRFEPFMEAVKLRYANL